jgi:hypothetical protein
MSAAFRDAIADEDIFKVLWFGRRIEGGTVDVQQTKNKGEQRWIAPEVQYGTARLWTALARFQPRAAR